MILNDTDAIHFTADPGNGIIAGAVGGVGTLLLLAGIMIYLFSGITGWVGPALGLTGFCIMVTGGYLYWRSSAWRLGVARSAVVVYDPAKRMSQVFPYSEYTFHALDTKGKLAVAGWRPCLGIKKGGTLMEYSVPLRDETVSGFLLPTILGKKKDFFAQR